MADFWKMCAVIVLLLGGLYFMGKNFVFLERDIYQKQLESQFSHGYEARERKGFDDLESCKVILNIRRLR